MKAFEKLLSQAESFSDRFPSLIGTDYDITNAFGSLHFLLARNVRYIRTSYELMNQHKYSESSACLRAVMEGALLTRYFASHPELMQKWHDFQIEINQTTDSQYRGRIARKKSKLYGPTAIMEKIASENKPLYEDMLAVYNELSEGVHPPILTECDFLIRNDEKFEVSREPRYDKRYLNKRLNVSILLLANTMMLFGTFYQKNFFKHLGRPFLLELKEMTDLINCLQKERKTKLVELYEGRV